MESEIFHGVFAEYYGFLQLFPVLFLEPEFSGGLDADPVPAEFLRCLLRRSFLHAAVPNHRRHGQALGVNIQVVPVQLEERLLLSVPFAQKFSGLLPVCQKLVFLQAFPSCVVL